LGCKFVAKPKHFVKKNRPLASPTIDSQLQTVPTKRMIVEENCEKGKINFCGRVLGSFRAQNARRRATENDDQGSLIGSLSLRFTIFAMSRMDQYRDAQKDEAHE